MTYTKQEILTAAETLDLDHPSKARMMRELLGLRSTYGRYALFYGSRYYPEGGFEDFKGCYHSVDEAKADVPKLDVYEWGHIVDMCDRRIILEAKRMYYGGPIVVWVVPEKD